jgi:hypothetical protein
VGEALSPLLKPPPLWESQQGQAFPCNETHTSVPVGSTVVLFIIPITSGQLALPAVPIRGRRKPKEAQEGGRARGARGREDERARGQENRPQM